MKKTLVLMIAMFALTTMLCGNVLAIVGPAPNSGDGVSDGSGMDNRAQNGIADGVVQGPAPNSGDGVSDGSGF